VIAPSSVQHDTIFDMATDAIRDRETLFDATLQTSLSNHNHHIAHPNPVFKLQDDIDVDDSTFDDVLADAGYGDMNQSA
jgi:hypothetical protein